MTVLGAGKQNKQQTNTRSKRPPAFSPSKESKQRAKEEREKGDSRAAGQVADATSQTSGRHDEDEPLAKHSDAADWPSAGSSGGGGDGNLSDGGHKSPPAQRRGPPVGRQRSLSLGQLLDESLVHELPATGERIVISRGWPANRKSARQPQRHLERADRSRSAVTVSRRVGRQGAATRTIDEQQKRRLLVEFLTREQQATSGAQAEPPRLARARPKRRPSVRRLEVQYELGVHDSSEPIAL